MATPGNGGRGGGVKDRGTKRGGESAHCGTKSVAVSNRYCEQRCKLHLSNIRREGSDTPRPSALHDHDGCCALMFVEVGLPRSGILGQASKG
eukprot:356295-Chlamydomonas_euryale.AAC.2